MTTLPSYQEIVFACQILDLDHTKTLTQADISSARRRQQKSAHTDQGGSDHLSKLVNIAADQLEAWVAAGQPDLRYTAQGAPDQSSAQAPPPEPEQAPQGQQTARHPEQRSAPKPRRSRLRDDAVRFLWYYKFRIAFVVLLLLSLPYLLPEYLGDSPPQYHDFSHDPVDLLNAEKLAKVPLYKQDERPLFWGIIAGICVTRMDPGCERVEQLIDSQAYKIISCVYGPMNASGEGYKTYTFWDGKVPSDIASYAIPGDYDHPFLILGMKGVSECPKDLNDARTAFQQGRLPQTAG